MRLADYIGKYWAGAEVIYAVIIAMTFTSTLRSYNLYIDAFVDKVVFSALFCCIAWGIADGAFYAWERRYIIRQENKIIDLSRSAGNGEPGGPAGSGGSVGSGESAVSLIGDQLDDTILRNISEDNRTKLYRGLMQYLKDAGKKQKPSVRDTLSIIAGTLISSTVAAVIVILPFFLIDDTRSALNISNLICIILLFMAGYFRALDGSLHARLATGIGTAFLGIIISVITIGLGG
jgi:hypothetical protein